MFSYPKIPAATVVIPTFGMKGVTLTEKCVRSLLAFHSHLGAELEIVVVEDSEDGDTLEFLTKTIQIHSPTAKVLSRPNGGFAKACNTGIQASNGQVVFLVNNDIEFNSPAIQMMADATLATRCGLMGCRLLYPNGTIQHAGVVFVPVQDQPIPGYFDHLLRNQHHLHPMAVTMRPSLVTGALMAIPRKTIELSGFLDETFEFAAEDIDYCLRVIELGMDVLYFGYASAFHREGATRGNTPEEKAALAPDVAEKESRTLLRLFDKWSGVNWMNFAP